MKTNKNHNRNIVPSPIDDFLFPSPSEKVPKADEVERGRERPCSPIEKLNCLQALLHRCEQWLAAEAGKQAIPAHRVLDTWLFESKEQWLQRYRAKQKVRERLQQLYQKQLALLSSSHVPCPMSLYHSSLINNQ